MKFTLSHSQLVEALNWRYAVKQFDPEKKISKEHWNSLQEALLLTPSSYGLQPWKFIVVENLELKKKLREASWKQSQVENCSHYLILTSLKKMDEEFIRLNARRMAEVREIPIEALDKFVSVVASDVIRGPRALIAQEWMARQCYIALGNLMTSAALLGIDACPMEGLEPKKYDDILGISNSPYQTIVACGLGYRHSDDKYQNAKKVRFSTDLIFDFRS